MGETVNNEKTPKTDFFKGLKAEFKKIIWPDKETVVKQTVAVLVTSIALGAIIAVLDLIMKFGIELIVR